MPILTVELRGNTRAIGDKFRNYALWSSEENLNWFLLRKEMINPDDPDQENETKLLNYCIAIGPRQPLPSTNFIESKDIAKSRNRQPVVEPFPTCGDVFQVVDGRVGRRHNT
ncbi:hypothetical protein TNCV_2210501 [Trichonephila clavipes]|nr:hypothetical protein TNCV_2210501 [Trichonephila clavipes]